MLKFSFRLHYSQERILNSEFPTIQENRMRRRNEITVVETLSKKKVERESVASDANSIIGAPNLMMNTSNRSNKGMSKQFSQIKPVQNRPRFLLKSKLSSKFLSNSLLNRN